ncbi:hypothetical protein [Psychrilyobacter sp.]
MKCKKCKFSNRKKHVQTIVVCPRTKNEVLVTPKFCIEKCDEK